MSGPELRLPFARLVRERMEERGTGLRELCRAVGLDPSFFSKVLANKRNPPSEERVLRRIAEELDIDPPRLVVAAGRVPSEWKRIWEDDTLFDSVHVLASGSARQRREEGPAWTRPPATAPAQKAPVPPAPARPLRPPADDFGEELL